MKGMIVYATEEAKKKHGGQEYKLEKKHKKQHCPQCELNLAKRTNFINEVISDELLNN